MKAFIGLSFLVWFVLFNCAIGQTQVVDSLKQLLQTGKWDSSRCLLLDRLSAEYQESKPDSALLLAQQELILARQIKFIKGEAEGLSRTGII